MSNPVGNPGKKALLREQHIRFIGEAFANTYNAGEATRMLQSEFGVEVTYNAVRYLRDKMTAYASIIEGILRDSGDYSPENIKKAVESIPKVKSKVRLTALFQAYFATKKQIAEDPSYGVAYANKRRRLLKLDQNIRELDDKKTFAKGSYPTEKNSDGSMTFKEFEISNKDHAEQRKHIEAVGELVDGQAGGDIIINIHDNPSTEETDTELERKRKQNMADLKAKKDANKAPNSEVKED